MGSKYPMDLAQRDMHLTIDSENPLAQKGQSLVAIFLGSWVVNSYNHVHMELELAHDNTLPL